jgi:hypothetical protein
MSDYVTLRHPKLPAEQTIRIARRLVGVRLAAGWEEVPEAPAPVVEQAEPKRRSRKTEEQ